MPPQEVYSIDFASGGWQPSRDVNGWGAMRSGGSSAGTLATQFGTGGLYLSAERPLGATEDVTNSVWVVPPAPTTIPFMPSVG